MQENTEEEQHETIDNVSNNTMTKMFPRRSEAAQEIISRKPGFLEKWALLLFMAILLLLVGATWFIRYPDIIEASGTLTGTNAPKEIIPLQTGRLIKLFVKNGDWVKKGEMIALHKGIPHSVAAVKESVFLLTIADCKD